MVDDEVVDFNLDVFTQPPTDSSGAWTEDEISALLNAWEEAVDASRSQPPGQPIKIADKILEILTASGFRHVERDDVVKQLSALRKYRTHLGLMKAGLPKVKESCVPQLHRVMRKATTRKSRRRQTSTASNQIGMSEDDGGNQNDAQSQPESTEETMVTRPRRVRFQGQTLQRSIRTMIGQQRTFMDYLQNVFNKIDESNSKMISLLEKVALQNPNYTKLN